MQMSSTIVGPLKSPRRGTSGQIKVLFFFVLSNIGSSLFFRCFCDDSSVLGRFIAYNSCPFVNLTALDCVTEFTT